MNNPIRQHFIPCCYLKYFSCDGNWGDARKTKIYFTDGVTSGFTTVNNLGVEKYTYSQENPAFDKQFHNMENHYPEIIEKLISGQRSFHIRDYFGLFMIMVDFNLRNVAYENRSEVERMHVYEAISRSFNSDLFSEAKGEGSDMHGMKDWLTENWRVQRVEPTSNEKFITTDNPSIVFSNPNNGRPVMLYLPVHPRIGIVAYDRRYLRISAGQVSDDALGILNGLQINGCVRHTFADHDLSNNQENWENLQNIALMPKPERWVDNERWQPSYISTASAVFERLTFIRRVSQ